MAYSLRPFDDDDAPALCALTKAAIEHNGTAVPIHNYVMEKPLN